LPTSTLDHTHLLLFSLPLSSSLLRRPPSSTLFPYTTLFRSQLLQCCKAGKWHADGELHTERLEPADGGIAEEGSVHAHFNHAPGLYGTHLLDTGLNKVLCAVAVMDIARTMPDIKHLAGLGDGAKQRIVTALAFLFAIEAHRTAFGKAPGGNNRAVEVQGDPRQAQSLQPRAHQLTIGLAQLLDTTVIHPGQGAADRSHIRQARHAQHAADHRIILVVTQILQTAVTEKQMDDQQQHDQAMAKDR